MTTTRCDAPAKDHRKGMSLIGAIRLLPDNAAAEAWFTAIRWPDGPTCRTVNPRRCRDGAKHKTMRYRCRTCRKRLSLKADRVMEASNLSFQEWAMALYLLLTGLKAVSSGARSA